MKQSERLPVRPRQLVFLGDSRRVVVLASAREDTSTLLVWDSNRGTLGPTDFSEPFAMHFDAALLTTTDRDHSVLVAGRNGLTRVAVEGVVARTSAAKPTFGSAPIRAIAVCQTASGPQTFVAVDDDAQSSLIVSFDLGTGRELARLPYRSGVITALAVSNDGRWLVTRATDMLSRPNGDLPDQAG